MKKNNKSGNCKRYDVQYFLMSIFVHRNKHMVMQRRGFIKYKILRLFWDSGEFQNMKTLYHIAILVEGYLIYEF